MPLIERPKPLTPDLYDKLGVYRIRCLVNDKVYIGGSYFSFYGRWSTHISQLRNSKHGNRHLQRSFNKHGEKNFVFEVMEQCTSDKVIEREQVWLDWLWKQPTRGRYNICTVAGSRLGAELSKESKELMRISNKNKTLGLKHTEESIGKMVEAALNSWANPSPARKEQLEKMKANGVPNTPESIERGRLSRLGRPLSAEHTKKLSEHWSTDEGRAIQSSRRKGCKNTKEVVERTTQASINFWNSPEGMKERERRRRRFEQIDKSTDLPFAKTIGLKGLVSQGKAIQSG